ASCVPAGPASGRILDELADSANSPYLPIDIHCHFCQSLSRRTEDAMSDKQLAARLRSGEDEQIRSVIARFDTVLRRIARRPVAPQHVDDVVQEAWIAALRGVHRYEGRGSFEGWLVAITANLARTWGVRESRSLPVEEVPEQIAPPDAEPERRLL